MKLDALCKLLVPVADRDLVFAFFVVFSRFEYSLKRAGFLKPKERAEADWDIFSNSICGRLLAIGDPEFQAAVKFLFTEPPHRQMIVGNGQLDWKNTVQGPGETDERYLLRLVEGVRNNLFHGGKYPDPIGVVPDVARNRKLLESSIAVLESCLALNPAVHSAFVEVA